jgi:hypothetical protein
LDSVPIEAANKFVAQLVRGVAYLLSCGVAHGGKIKVILKVNFFFVSLISHFTYLHLGNIPLGSSSYLARNYKSYSRGHAKYHSPA